MHYKKLKTFIEKSIRKDHRHITFFLDDMAKIRVGYFPTDISMAGLSRKLPPSVVKKLHSLIPNLIYSCEKQCIYTGKPMRFTTISKLSGTNPSEIVDRFITKYEHGFTQEEMDFIIKTNYPDISMKHFNDAMFGNTCMISDDNENQMIHYHGDVRAAITCGIENRQLTVGEWD